MDPERSDSHHTAREERYLYRKTAAGVSCKRTIRELCVKTSVVVTLESSTSRLKNYCPKNKVSGAGPCDTSAASWADPASGARPRDASDCANFIKQVVRASWSAEASGARPRDAND